MRFMLDTTICIDAIRHAPAAVLRRLKRCALGDVCISSITLSELEFGAAKSSDVPRNRLALALFSAPIVVMPYDDTAAVRYGPLRAYLQSRGTPIGPLDLLIAAHALSLGVTLVSSNVREFARVPALRIVDWRK